MILDKKTIIRLEKKYGNPFYVFDEDAFLENYHRFNNVMLDRYEKYQLAYSFKTNYTPYICKTISKLGGFAEVVSAMEYDIAIKVGFDPSRIIFNGPDKECEIDEPFISGSIINADNLKEIGHICDVANYFPEKEFQIGVRVNLNIGQGFVSRFGMNEQDLECAFELVKKRHNLSIVGLHCHISRCRDIASWEKRTEHMIKLADRFFDMPPLYIDLGSGMYGDMEPELAAQFTNVPTYDEYADATAKIIATHYSEYSLEHKPILITEPGTTIINRYVSLVARVDSIKKLEGKTFATLNCSEHNLGEVSMLKKLPFRIVDGTQKGSTYENVDFVGYTCLEQDLIFSGFKGRLGIGDYVVFGNVGGYSNVLKPPFIRPNCPMIVLSEGKDKLIKRAETTEDFMRTYVY